MNAVDIGEYHYSALPAIVEVKAGGSEVNPKMESGKTTGDESGPDDSTGGSESGPDDSTYGDESGPDDSTGGDESLSDDSEVSSPDSLDDSEDDSTAESNDDSDSTDSKGDDTSAADDTVSGGNSGGGNSTPEKIPQTGQLWWPVPMLAVIGLVLIALGLRVRSGKGGKNE